ncbi:MAG: TonB-dependent receptor, partial [gamma proteobacterium endosymbiont of Lamellibrachia anaximandri]|nr:TonB-dependent receptor [gamma proteobacterium endosymbiont of Lamellibrachia anaximandri]
MDAYLDLELEDLLSMEVTSVSKKKQRLNEVAAAAYVITQDDIRRSGVTSIPEALRLAPGIQVAKMDGNKWAISSRGFNAQFANKLLVLIDGRSVYTPSYSGVYWEVQDTVLQDIDRIEVIRGPGATVWGANAVNGVVNIITKQASETQGGLLVVGAGNEEKALTSLRYGAELGEQTFGKIYLKYNNRDSSYAPLPDEQAGDDWKSLSAGFRVDGVLNVSNRWTLQGDIYETDENQILQGVHLDPADPANSPPYRDQNVADIIEASGWNLLGRWEQRLSEDSSTTLQIYYDHNERKERVLGQRHDTLDIDFQHRFAPLEGHDIVWGLGYRRIQHDFDNTFSVSLTPEEQTSDLFSTFVQDEIELAPDTLRLTLGSKFEHNDYTGFEVQPSARLLWMPKEGHSLWSSVSRAVRTPSQVEDSASIVTRIIPIGPPPIPPMVLKFNGSENFEAEELTAIELGYRVQPAERLSLDLALFYNQYNNLATLEPASLTELIFDNKLEATSRGLELAMDWHLLEWWRLQANYSYIELEAETASDSVDQRSGAIVEGSSPKHQLSLRSAMDFSNEWSLDLWAYYVDELAASSFSSTPIPGYTSLNTRLAWRPWEDMELSLVGQ